MLADVCALSPIKPVVVVTSPSLARYACQGPCVTSSEHIPGLANTAARSSACMTSLSSIIAMVQAMTKACWASNDQSTQTLRTLRCTHIYAELFESVLTTAQALQREHKA